MQPLTVAPLARVVEGADPYGTIAHDRSYLGLPCVRGGVSISGTGMKIELKVEESKSQRMYLMCV